MSSVTKHAAERPDNGDGNHPFPLSSSALMGSCFLSTTIRQGDFAMRSKITNIFLAFGLGTTLLVAGCGGGGGTTSSVTYTGVTAEAVVTNENADALLRATMEAEVGEGLDILVATGANAEESSQTGLSLPGLADLLAGMKDLVGSSAPTMAAGATSSETVYGDCGGSVTIAATGTGDESSFTASGSMVYSSFCVTTPEGDVVINGSANFTMSGLDTSFTFTLATSNLTVSTGGQSVTYNLTYTVSFDGETLTATLNSDYQAADGKVYRVQDYRVVFDDFGGLSISGKIYHPEHGYVVISTPQPLQYSFCDEYYRPTSGTVRVEGIEGTWAEFSAVDCTQYQVCVNDAGCELYSW